MLVTHQLQYLPSADEVVVVREGRLAERGPYQALVQRGVDFHQFEQAAAAEGAEDASSAGDASSALSAAGDDSAEEAEGSRRRAAAGAAGAGSPQPVMSGPRDSAIELQSRGQAPGGEADEGDTAGSMPDASGGICAAAETAGAVFSDVLLDSPTAAGGSSQPAGGEGSRRSSRDLTVSGRGCLQMWALSGAPLKPAVE